MGFPYTITISRGSPLGSLAPRVGACTPRAMIIFSRLPSAAMRVSKHTSLFPYLFPYGSPYFWTSPLLPPALIRPHSTHGNDHWPRAARRGGPGLPSSSAASHKIGVGISPSLETLAHDTKQSKEGKLEPRRTSWLSFRDRIRQTWNVSVTEWWTNWDFRLFLI